MGVYGSKPAAELSKVGVIINACWTPEVCCANSGVTEVLSSGVTGVLFFGVTEGACEMPLSARHFQTDFQLAAYCLRCALQGVQRH